jgi:outer membrane protein assembly factor BamB
MGTRTRAPATIVLLWSIGLTLAGERQSADWPQWRGPNRDGVVRGVPVPSKWPSTLKEEWKVTVGEGVASPVVVGDDAIVFTRQAEHEVVRCIGLKTGKEEWRSSPYSAPRVRGLGAGNFSFGPRSTPTVAGGRVFTLGVGGVLSCLDARTGKLLWRQDSKGYPGHGACASPLVVDGLCIVHTGGGARGLKAAHRPRDLGGVTAFDVGTGEVKWRLANTVEQDPAYGSPILVHLAGERQVVTFTAGFYANMIGLAPGTGKRLWRLRDTPGDMLDGNGACLTPVLYDDLIIFADYQKPLCAIRLQKGARGIQAQTVWKATGPPVCYYSSPVVCGDWLVGYSEQRFGHLFCLDARTGKTLWQSRGRLGPYASLLNLGSAWLVLTNPGQLIVVKPSGTAYEPIATYRVSESQTWAHPVFLGDRILIKDDTTLRLFRIAQADGKE